MVTYLDGPFWEGTNEFHANGGGSGSGSGGTTVLEGYLRLIIGGPSKWKRVYALD